MIGDHTSRAGVLAWLRGAETRPWSGAVHGGGDAVVLDALRTKVLAG